MQNNYNLIFSFFPLLAALALSFFTALKKYQSVVLREFSAVFLSLSFFAAVYLTGQNLRLSINMKQYLFLSAVFTLPAAYLFRSKAALTVYTACCFFAETLHLSYALFLPAFALPLFYLEIKRTGNRGLLCYLLTLAYVLICFSAGNLFIPYGYGYLTESVPLVISLSVGFFIIDEVFHKISPVYFTSPVKVMGIFCVSIALFIYGYDFLWTASLLWALPVSALSFVYAALRAVNYKGVKAGDFFVAAALIFTFFAPFYPFWASVALSLSLGIILMIRGHKKKRLAYFITGLFLLLLTVMAKASGSMIFSFPLLFCIFSFFAYKEYHGKGKG